MQMAIEDSLMRSKDRSFDSNCSGFEKKQSKELAL
jgi:hypothetical protein